MVILPLTVTKNLGGFILQSESTSGVVAAVRTTKAAGVSSLWLETHSPEALKYALREASSLDVTINLVIRPWAMAPNEKSNDPDRTISGLSDKGLHTMLAENQSWSKFWQEQSAYSPRGYERWSPGDPELPAHWRKLADLSKVPGISQIALVDAWSTGYASLGNNTSYSYFYSNALDNFNALGYSQAMRLAFLRAQKADPADFENQMVRTRVSLREVWGDLFINDLTDDWQRAKGKWCREAVTQLVNIIRSRAVPILLEGQPEKTHNSPYSSLYLWKQEPAKELPILPIGFQGEKLANNCEAQVVTILDDPDPDQRDRVAARLKGVLENSSKNVILDFTSIPSGRWKFVISKWLKSK